MDLLYKLGIFSWFGFFLPIQKRLEMIKEAGFDATSIWWEDEEGEYTVYKKDFPAMVKDNGLVFENIHAPFNDCEDLWSQTASRQDRFLKDHISWLNDCAKYEMPVMVMHVIDESELNEPNLSGIKLLDKLIYAAQDLEITIAIENTRRPNFVDVILSEIPSPTLGFCYDSSHDWLTSKNKAELLKKYGSRLAATHISDNDGVVDRHWPPYDGIIDWDKVIDAFPKDTYKGFLTLETLAKEEDQKNPPQSFLKRAYERSVKLCRAIEAAEKK
ncbi:sugar phosphate isomerase/epimerase family protein [Oxobacter pfennigii]|nr:sugar phosphate isomerase/epimerase [Oxobacter pfennigii]